MKFQILSLLIHLLVINYFLSGSAIFISSQKASSVEVSLIPKFNNEQISVSSKVIKKSPKQNFRTQLNSVAAMPTQSQSEKLTVKSTALGINTQYPRLSRVLSEEGTVVLAISTNSMGAIDKIKTLSSSGFSRLDEAAITSLKREVTYPFASSSEIEISFQFKLK